MAEGAQIDEFRCDVVPERELVRVVPVGDVDITTGPLVQQQIEELLEAGFTHLVVDLRETSFMDSSGLAVLMRCNEAARARDIEFKVIPGSQQVARLIEVSGIADRLTLISADLAA